jgi:hypothetical protein
VRYLISPVQVTAVTAIPAEVGPFWLSSAGRPERRSCLYWERVMPRLQGKSSSAPAVLTVILVLVAAFLVLEYFGVINVIPNFGRP